MTPPASTPSARPLHASSLDSDSIRPPENISDNIDMSESESGPPPHASDTSHTADTERAEPRTGADADVRSLLSDNAPPPPASAFASERSRRAAVRQRAAHYAALVPAAVLGCLIRLGLEALGRYDGQVIFELAWAQGVGCGVMGLALGLREGTSAFYPPLYTFLTTGLAGSITTFSSWMLGGYISFANMEGYRRGGLQNTVDGVAYSLATMTISLGSMYAGEHVAACLASVVSGLRASRARSTSTAASTVMWTIKGSAPRSDTPTPTSIPQGRQPPILPPPSPSPRPPAPALSLAPQTQASLDVALLLLAPLTYLVLLLIHFLGPSSWHHTYTLPLLLSPPGAILRFFLATYNTRRPFVNAFPIGTFAVNMVGSALIGGVYAAQRLESASGSGGSGGGGARCDALHAIEQGFCGCLTTVSTFMLEARAIRGKRRTWVYVLGSVVLGHVAVLVTLGVVSWTRELGPACGA